MGCIHKKEYSPIFPPNYSWHQISGMRQGACSQRPGGIMLKRDSSHLSHYGSISGNWKRNLTRAFTEESRRNNESSFNIGTLGLQQNDRHYFLHFSILYWFFTVYSNLLILYKYTALASLLLMLGASPAVGLGSLLLWEALTKVTLKWFWNVLGEHPGGKDKQQNEAKFTGRSGDSDTCRKMLEFWACADITSSILINFLFIEAHVHSTNIFWTPLRSHL